MNSKFRLACALLLIIAITTVPVTAAPSSETGSPFNQILSIVKDIQTKLDSILTMMTSLQTDVTTINTTSNTINQKLESLEEIQTDVDTIQSSLDDLPTEFHGPVKLYTAPRYLEPDNSIRYICRIQNQSGMYIQGKIYRLDIPNWIVEDEGPLQGGPYGSVYIGGLVVTSPPGWYILEIYASEDELVCGCEIERRNFEGVQFYDYYHPNDFYLERNPQ